MRVPCDSWRHIARTAFSFSIRSLTTRAHALVVSLPIGSGAAVNSKLFPIFGTLDSPYTLATSVRDLCNTGGGDFGDLLYTIALVNLPGPKITGGANPGLGYTTLSLAGSIAAHAGHSGILSAPSSVPNAGRFSPQEWARLQQRSVGGYITGESLAHWVAENMLLDPLATPWNVLSILAHITKAIADGVPVLVSNKFHQAKPAAGSLQPAAAPLKTERDLEPVRQGVLASLASNLFNAAAEMAFICTTFQNSPNTRQPTAGAPLTIGISLADMQQMFVDRKLPAGFTSWPKRKADFQKIIGPMALTAAKALIAARVKGIKSPAAAQPYIGKI